MVAFFPRSSGWFDCTEPSLATSVQGKQGLQGASTRVRRVRNLLHRRKQGVQGARTQGRGSEPPRTFSNHMTTERAGRVAVFHRRLGWFACTEPSLATSSQGKQGVQGARARVGGGSRTSNLLDSNHTDLLWKPSIHTLFTLR